MKLIVFNTGVKTLNVNGASDSPIRVYCQQRNLVSVQRKTTDDDKR